MLAPALTAASAVAARIVSMLVAMPRDVSASITGSTRVEFLGGD